MSESETEMAATEASSDVPTSQTTPQDDAVVAADAGVLSDAEIEDASGGAPNTDTPVGYDFGHLVGRAIKWVADHT